MEFRNTQSTGSTKFSKQNISLTLDPAPFLLHLGKNTPAKIQSYTKRNKTVQHLLLMLIHLPTLVLAFSQTIGSSIQMLFQTPAQEAILCQLQ